MRTEARRGKQGFTLLELLVALAIFSIGMLALIPLFGMASWGARGGRDLTTGTTLARTYIDKIRNTPFTNIGPCDPANPGNAAATCTPPPAEVTANAPFTVTWTVTAVNGAAYNFDPLNPPNPNMKRVRVTVTRSCTGCPNGQRRVEMTTIISAQS